MNLPEDDVGRILQAVIETDGGDGWSDSIRVEMLLRRDTWKTKSSSFPTMVFGQFVREEKLIRKSGGETTLYHVTKKAIDDFALSAPESYNSGKGETGGAAPSNDPATPVSTDVQDKARAVVLAVYECANEDGLAQDTSVFSAIRRSTGRWASIQWTYFSTEMGKFIKGGWLERGDGLKRNCYRLTNKGRELLKESGTGVDDNHSPPPDQGGVEDLPVAKPSPPEPSASEPPVESVPTIPPAEIACGPPPAGASFEEDPPPQQDDGASVITTTQEERGKMKPKERAQRMLFSDRVRLAWINTPGKTAEEKQEYVFNRHATDRLQEIFGLGSPLSAQAFLVKLSDEGLINDDCWTDDMSNYTGTSGGTPDGDDRARRVPKIGPRPRATPEPPAEDAADDAGESTETNEVTINDLNVVLAQAAWMAPVLKIAALLGQMQSERALALAMIRQFATLSGEDMSRVLKILGAIFPEPPAESNEEE